MKGTRQTGSVALGAVSLESRLLALPLGAPGTRAQRMDGRVFQGPCEGQMRYLSKASKVSTLALSAAVVNH